MNIFKNTKNPQFNNLMSEWRNKICDIIFLYLSILGLIAYIPSFILSIRDDLIHIAIIDTVCYGIIVFITFNKKISHKIKAIVGSAVFYILGILLLILLGPIGAGNLWLLGFSLVAAFTLGENGAKISFTINVLTQIMIFLIIRKGYYIDTLSIDIKGDIWLIRSVNFIVINLIIMIANTVLVKQLNITFSKQKESEEKLIISEIRMRKIFEESPLGMMLINYSDGVVLESNSRLKLLLGLEDNKILNKKWTSLIHPDEILIIESIKDDGKNKTFSDFRFIHKNGKIVVTELKIVKVKISTTKEICFIAMVRDISKEILMEEEKNKLQEQLAHRHKMEALGQLAGGIAHDFNNLLTGILSASELLMLPKNELNEKNQKFVSMIHSSSIRASDLINKMLAFSRKGKIITSTHNINHILDDTIQILDRTIDKKITISLTQNTINNLIDGDYSAIENAFINLGINASDSMNNGGEIQIKTKNIIIDKKYCDISSFKINPGEFIQIEIIDSGTGINKQNIKKIFDPFFTTKELGKGTGLGLSAVYGTIQEHQGAIQVNSEIGIGTTFTILLPCSEKLEIEGNKTRQVLNSTGTILVVEDEEINRILIEEILISLGYKVYLATDGAESIDIFHSKHSEIDIVLLDMMMPKMNGTEVFYRMKEIDKNCKVIICSGYTQNENIDALIKNGLKGFIHKPYKIPELSQLLKHL